MRDFTPHSRRKNPEPRIHEELTDTARVRLYRALSHIEVYYIATAHKKLLDHTGRGADEFKTTNVARKTSANL
jgi:hypothetical protein